MNRAKRAEVESRILEEGSRARDTLYRETITGLVVVAVLFGLGVAATFVDWSAR